MAWRRYDLVKRENTDQEKPEICFQTAKKSAKPSQKMMVCILFVWWEHEQVTKTKPGLDHIQPSTWTTKNTNSLLHAQNACVQTHRLKVEGS